MIVKYEASKRKVWDWIDIKRWSWDLLQEDGSVKTVEHHLNEKVLFLDEEYQSIKDYVEVDEPLE